MNGVLDQVDKKKAPSSFQWCSENCADLNIRGAVRTMELAIQSTTVKDAIAGLEHIGLRAGRAPMLGWCVRKGIEQHVNVTVDEGVSMELVCHITSDVKNKL
jgi:hypothetical protein